MPAGATGGETSDADADAACWPPTGGLCAAGRRSQCGRPAWTVSYVSGPAYLRRLLSIAALAAVGTATGVLPAVAAEAGGNGQFGITPAPDANGIATPYFTLTVLAGGSATATAVITNQSDSVEKLRLGRSTGITAVNGGSAYSRPFQRCAGPGCWVSGLPGTLTLPAQAREQLTFAVRVPARTRSGQYLAGLTAEEAARPRPVQVGSNGRGAKAQAIIVRQVTVGVAVTVGSLSSLTTRLRIAAVAGTAIGRMARLNILLRNTGQTFTHARGRASCTSAGKRHSYPVYAGTVLPGDQAVIPANAPGLAAGAPMPCAVRLRYGAGLAASWAGQVTVPAPPAARVVHTGPGAYSVIPPATIPAWAIALIVIGALILAAMAVLLARTRRRGRAT
jgi:hypothetical protein